MMVKLCSNVANEETPATKITILFTAKLFMFEIFTWWSTLPVYIDKIYSPRSNVRLFKIHITQKSSLKIFFPPSRDQLNEGQDHYPYLSTCLLSVDNR